MPEELLTVGHPIKNQGAGESANVCRASCVNVLGQNLHQLRCRLPIN